MSLPVARLDCSAVELLCDALSTTVGISVDRSGCVWRPVMCTS
jgi:hypothetical protein